jgi:hypothetical protein
MHIKSGPEHAVKKTPDNTVERTWNAGGVACVSAGLQKRCDALLPFPLGLAPPH